MDPSAQSEDCLVLNVWTPAVPRRSALLPVMVWIHGGAFVYGSGGVPMYDGHNLAKEGHVVVVTINHRLNIFGYADLAAHADEQFASSANVGQLDLVAALRWVKDNITGFGGNPANVTVFGESGGGAKITALLAMPCARGLIHKAIVQSGSALRAHERDFSSDMADRIYRFFKLRSGDTAALQALPPRELLRCFQVLTAGELTAEHSILDFGPVVDGEVIPRQPWDPMAPALVGTIPMIIGTTSQETVGFIGAALADSIPDDEVLLQRVAQ